MHNQARSSLKVRCWKVGSNVPVMSQFMVSPEILSLCEYMHGWLLNEFMTCQGPGETLYHARVPISPLIDGICDGVDAAFIETSCTTLCVPGKILFRCGSRATSVI